MFEISYITEYIKMLFGGFFEKWYIIAGVLLLTIIIALLGRKKNK